MKTKNDTSIVAITLLGASRQFGRTLHEEQSILIGQRQKQLLSKANETYSINSISDLDLGTNV